MWNFFYFNLISNFLNSFSILPELTRRSHTLPKTKMQLEIPKKKNGVFFKVFSILNVQKERRISLSYVKGFPHSSFKLSML